MQPATQLTPESRELANLKVALLATARCTQAVMRAGNENALVQQVCEIIIDAGYRFCWGGSAEHNHEKTVRPLAWAGHEDGYLSAIAITWSDAESGRGPVGTAIRTRTTRIIHDSGNDPEFAPWRIEAQKRGYVSVCALPLLDHETAFGSLNIYSDSADAFAPPQLALLSSFAETLAYGITLLRTRTEQSRMQERLRSVEEMAYLAADATDIGTWHWNLQTNQMTWSDKTKQILAVPLQQEIDYEFFIKIIHPEDREAILREIAKTLQQQIDYRVETRVVCPDGETRWMAIRGRASYDPSGKPLRMRGVARDITERHRIEQERQKLVEVVQNSPEFIGIATPQGKVLFVNQAGRTLVGIDSDEEAISKVIFDYLPPDEISRVGRDVLPLVLSGKSWEGEALLKHFQTGELIPVEMRAFPICNAQGEVTAIANVSRDIRRRKQRDEVLRQTEARLREINRELEKAKERLTEEKLYLEQEIDTELGFGEIIGKSKELKKVLEQVAEVASSDATALLLGETGTGKELIARVLHHTSKRREQVFVKINCAAIPAGLLESELFGHEKGAFSGAVARKLGLLELADKGTLFLDEIGEIPLELQPKLLRVLQDQEFERVGSTRTLKVNFRLIAATNRDAARSAGETVPQRSLLSLECVSHPNTAFARKANRHSFAGRTFRAQACAAHEENDHQYSEKNHECADPVRLARKCARIGELRRTLGDSDPRFSAGRADQ